MSVEKKFWVPTDFNVYISTKGVLTGRIKPFASDVTGRIQVSGSDVVSKTVSPQWGSPKQVSFKESNIEKTLKKSTPTITCSLTDGTIPASLHVNSLTVNYK